MAKHIVNGYPTFELLDLGAYPAMVLDGKTAIHGEVYEVDDELLTRLDKLEATPISFSATGLPCRTTWMSGYT